MDNLIFWSRVPSSGIRVLYLGQNTRRILQVVLLAESLQLFDTGVLAFAHDHGALLTGRAVGERQIISRCEGPGVVFVHEEREVLCVIVAVMRQHIEAR